MCDKSRIITESTLNGVIVLQFEDLCEVADQGRFDQLARELRLILDRNVTCPVILDFEGKRLPFCTYFIILLGTIHKKLRSNLKACNVSPDDMSFFNAGHEWVRDALNIYPTRETALASCDGRG